MSDENTNVPKTVNSLCELAGVERLRSEFQHLRSDWWWLLLYGVLLAVCGSAALIFPALTVLTSFVAVVMLGIALIIAGIATIIAALWAGRWSGMLLQLLVGVLYSAVGFMIMDTPLLKSVEALTLFVAAFFLVVGGFRIIASLTIHFPFWGWSLLNGIVTFLLGVIIYRLYHHFPPSSIWILGLLIGIEMLFNGWTWIMLSLAIRNIPEKAAE
jgi:uncharacterized membrane protein HdeD (DUF308 family)